MDHIFSVEAAVEYGIPAAVILKNLDFWCRHNEANKRNYRDGMYWTYNSIKAFEELFPYLGRNTIVRAIDKLISEGLIVKDNFNSDKHDRTTWYAVTKKGKSIISKWDNGLTQNGRMEKPKMGECIYTDINTDINTDVNESGATAPFPPKKKTFGEYHHVRLTDSQYEKLVESYGEDIIKEYIIKVDEYCQQYGKSYKDYYLTIRNWLRKDGKGELTELAKTVQARRAKRKDDEVPF